MRTLVLDNGSFAIKSGYVDSTAAARTIPNTVARTRRTKRVLVGDTIDRATDLSGLYYRSPFERGHLVHWDAELAVWDRILGPECLDCQPTETNLVLTEPVFNFAQLQRTADEIVFEEYGFASLLRGPAPRFSVGNAGDLIYGDGRGEPECVLVVDAGHAFTYAVPYQGQKQIDAGVRRVDVGGRMLTNYLKEMVSFRYWDMMDETYIMNAVKEQCCFVSSDFGRDLEATRAGRSLGLEYVLPDFSVSRKGFIRGQGGQAELAMDKGTQQVLPLGNERFAVPEALFHPPDVGLAGQGGIHHAVSQAVLACPEDLRAPLLANIVLVGGSANLPGLRQRLEAEVQALAPHPVRVFSPDAPQTWAWDGACSIASLDKAYGLTKTQYQEMGADRTIAHFEAFA
ncbi:Actin- protein 6 [Coemansia sp. RSA 552]|nr:Actin- protein 6 [Coemansia sp. RSA 552]